MSLFNDVLTLVAVVSADMPSKDAQNCFRSMEHEWIDDRFVGIRAKFLNGSNDRFHLECAVTAIDDCGAPRFQVGRARRRFLFGLCSHR